MPLVLQRSSLIAQVADALRKEVLSGTWKEWIPSERDISRTLHVSRNTCRNSLQVLRREMLIVPVRGRGMRVNPAATRKVRSAVRRQVHSIGIISLEPPARMPSFSGSVLDELRDEMILSGVRVQLHTNPIYYRGGPDRALKRLVQQSRHDCWIIVRSNEHLQRWFVENAIPCVVSGAVHPGVNLSSVDQDRRAICRHATGRFISLGHRRLAFVNRHTGAAGDRESEVGFWEAVKSSSHAGVEARVVYHDDTRESTFQAVDALWTTHALPPTGLLIANSHCYLAAMCALARRGLRVPQDVSLISRDDDNFLNYLDPEPARYRFEPHLLARKLASLVRRLLEHPSAKPERMTFVSPFIDGDSCRPI